MRGLPRCTESGASGTNIDGFWVHFDMSCRVLEISGYTTAVKCWPNYEQSVHSFPTVPPHSGSQYPGLGVQISLQNPLSDPVSWQRIADICQ